VILDNLTLERSQPVVAAGLRTYEQARQQFGRALFKGDWIGDLSANERKAIKLYVVQRFLPPGRRIEVVAPLDKNSARRLDLALGRRARMLAQFQYVMDWMDERGFDWRAKTVSAAQVTAALANVSTADPKVTLKTGPRDEKFRWALGMVEEDLSCGSLTKTTLTNMRLKEIETRYGVKKNVADKVRRHFAQ
jgi:hypothetical protein